LFRETFHDCTGLTVADMSNWATNNNVWDLGGTFNGCTNISLVKIPSSRVVPATVFGSGTAGVSPFQNVGTTTTNGTTFELEGLDLSNSTATSAANVFSNCKINGNTSDFSNWKFSSNITSIGQMFYFAQVAGTNPTLNCSGWTTLQANNFAGTFRGLNSSTSPNNLTLNVSNWNVSNATTFGLFMGHIYSANRIANIIGLSTWGATPGGVNLGFFFCNMAYLKLTSDDNFSDTFINSLTPTSIGSAFQSIGSSLSSGDFGEPPNLASLDLSSCAYIGGAFSSSHFSSLPDFTNVTFPTLPVDWSSFLRNVSTDSVVPHLDLSNITFKPTNLSRAFEAFRSANKITFPSGSNSDLSSLTNMSFTFYNAGNASNELEVILPTDADYSNVISWANTFNGLNGPGTDTLTTCVGDTLIRRIYATAFSKILPLNLVNTKLTGPPSVVDSYVTDLTTGSGAWTIASNATDAVMPFVYTTPLTTGISATPTGSFTGGTFSSSNSNIAVNATTGEINTPNAGNATIRYTLADGCYNEQALVVDPASIPLAQINNVYSMEFDGASDISIGPRPSLNATPFTWSFWINYTSTTTRAIYSQGSSSLPFTQTAYLAVNGTALTVYLGSTYITGTGFLTENEWQHVVVTRDSSSVVRLYRNGVVFESAGTIIGGSQPASNGSIGSWTFNGGTGLYFTGKIDEGAIWDIALTDEEILSIYNATEVVAGVNKTADLSQLTTPPVKWYRMGD
jgi:hypothetical protein